MAASEPKAGTLVFGYHLKLLFGKWFFIKKLLLEKAGNPMLLEKANFSAFAGTYRLGVIRIIFILS